MSLEVKIKKRLKNFVLEVEFDTREGIVGILGASGCGKSMTLKSIAGLVTPDEGRIVLNGKVFFDSEKKINLPPQKRRVGYLFQNYALFPNMTVEENIQAGLFCSKIEKKKKVQEMIKLLRLEGLETQYPDQLSGGQQQRVAFARLLAYDPEVLLLDEPFSALDSHLKEQLQIQLKEILSHYDKTVLMVSHDRNEIYRLSSDIITMKNGEILQYGSTKEVFQYPKDPITARLIGYKNLSLAKKLDDYRVEALEWNMIFRTTKPIPSHISYLGIQEKGICLRANNNEAQRAKKESNVFFMEVVDVLEEPYEYHVLVRAKEGDKGNNRQESMVYHQREIWCVVKKEEIKEEIGIKKGDCCTISIEESQILFF